VKIKFSSLIPYAAALLLNPFCPTQAADPSPVVVCYPGGPVSETEANAAMNAMLRVVERVGEWEPQRFNSFFTADVDECRRLLSSKKPSFAITSLGLFLEQRQAHHLIPVVQPRMRGASSERYHVMVRKGSTASLDALKGKSVGGTVFEEPEFMSKIVFAGRIDPRTFFNLKPGRQAIRALRALDKGELDAVILNGQQFAALASLPLKTPLEAVFTSAEIPLMGLVADETSSSAGDRSRFAKALSGMCADTEGKKLCDLFGVEAFTAVNPAVFAPMIALWQ
jgi:ABC-type amino acid transport substrate-binding protein